MLMIRCFRHERIQFPRRIRAGVNNGGLLRDRPERSRVNQILHHPRNAGRNSTSLQAKKQAFSRFLHPPDRQSPALGGGLCAAGVAAPAGVGRHQDGAGTGGYDPSAAAEDRRPRGVQRAAGCRVDDQLLPAATGVLGRAPLLRRKVGAATTRLPEFAFSRSADVCLNRD